MDESPRIMAHLVAFNPDKDGSREVARGLLEGGCAYIEVQFPFSDPTADGPDIQRACSRALAAGFTLRDGFRLLEEMAAFAEVPLFVMSYANPVFTWGVKRFVTECTRCGAQGSDRAGPAAGLRRRALRPCRRRRPHRRARRFPIDQPGAARAHRQSKSRLPVRHAAYRHDGLPRGGRSRRSFLSLAHRGAANAATMKILGGFGVSTGEQVKQVATLTHAVVVGSAIVRAIEAGGDPRCAAREKMAELVGAK